MPRSLTSACYWSATAGWARPRLLDGFSGRPSIQTGIPRMASALPSPLSLTALQLDCTCRFGISAVRISITAPTLCSSSPSGNPDAGVGYGKENQDSFELEGITFRNQPLAYWIDIVRQQGDPASAVLIVQTKCDRPEQEVLPFPLLDGQINALSYRKQLHVSPKERRGVRALEEALEDAIGWLREPTRLGLPQIGAGRLRVQRRLEALRDADMRLPPKQRQQRLLDRQKFEDLCLEEGGVSSPELLLAYLDANGTILYRKGFFGDRIVLDQGWALDAIYALFDRKRVYHELRRLNGRFSRSLLGLLVWQEHSDADQELLLSMMRSCGICFLHRRFGDTERDDPEYLAPDLLPERNAIAGSLATHWTEERPDQRASFRYALLHGGLIRAVTADIGEIAGADALYWRGGICGYEATSAAGC